MKVNSIEAAWKEANKLFPTDYDHDISSSERAGYPVYRSTAEGHYYDRICDLGCRLEIVLDSSKQPTVNIWIEEEPEPESAPEVHAIPGENRHIEVKVTAAKSGAVKEYASYDEFINEFRFFMSGGIESNYKGGDEAHFKKLASTLMDYNDHGLTMSTIRSGLNISFTYKRWDW